MTTKLLFSAKAPDLILRDDNSLMMGVYDQAKCYQYKINCSTKIDKLKH